MKIFSLVVTALAGGTVWTITSAQDIALVGPPPVWLRLIVCVLVIATALTNYVHGLEQGTKHALKRMKES